MGIRLRKKKWLLLALGLGLGYSPAYTQTGIAANRGHNKAHDLPIVLKAAHEKGGSFSESTRKMKFEVKGRVTTQEDGQTLPGVAVVLKENPSVGTVTDINGDYALFVPDGTATLIFSFVGYLKQEVPVSNRNEINIVLQPDLKVLEEVVVVGFGEQRKASMVSSITSVRTEELKTPTSNLTNAVAGRVAGIISFQQSGEPGMGTDNSTFYIRGLSTFGSGKRDPLILIDGIESTPMDMARLQPDDISDFSVLKDAAASSIYGARGANGVVLINTKSGKAGAVKLNFRVENRISTNSRSFKFADNITYMELANEAAVGRSPLDTPPYSQNKINSTRAAEDPYLFPNNNWLDQLVKDYTMNQGYNLNLSGGTEKTRFYVAGTYNRDNGILKVDAINNFNSNIRLNNYSIRSNVDMDLTPTTLLTVRMYGQFDDYTGPIGTRDEKGNLRSGGATTFDNAMRANPVLFPAVYPRDKMPYVEHPLFGSADLVDRYTQQAALYMNPYAEMVKGYQTYKTSNLNPQLEIKQDLEFLTEGLSFRGMTYFKRTSRAVLDRFYDPFLYKSSINAEDGSYTIKVLNDGSSESIGRPGTPYLSYNEIEKDIASQFWLQGAMHYDRTFNNKHTVGGLLVSYMSSFESGNAGNLIKSLPNRNNGISGRFTYGFDDRYLAEFNFGYNGSERFSKKHRYGFFPSAGLGYRISNEAFFDPLKTIIPNLKFRATYGLVGNDQIGERDERFLYMSNVSLNDPFYGSSFGRNDGAPLYGRPGVSISRYSNEEITWEQSRQLNLGMDLNLKVFSGEFEIIVDAFKQYRSHILQKASHIDNAAGLMATPLSNYGKAESQGVDFSTSYYRDITKDLSVEMRGTFTYATSKAVRVDELTYQDELAHLSETGHPIGQNWGLIAERLFIDDEEVANSPVQFGDTKLKGGDIKYRDVTGDGVVNWDDRVPIGFPKDPEVMYGFGTNFRYKNLDLNIFFQGAGRASFLIEPLRIQPFLQYGGQQNGLMQAVADDHWSEENRDPYAFWPRLSTLPIISNSVPSTWWLRNASFLRLKNVELGYNVGEVKKLGIKNARVYFSGINLLMFSKFKLWDVEMRENAFNYPIQTVYNMGIQVNL